MDFDSIIDRRGTGALKWDGAGAPPGTPPPDARELIPLWVADMDFLSPPEISAALKKRAAHGIYGYTVVLPEYYTALASWYKGRHHIEIPEEDFVSGRGAVPGLGTALRAWSNPGDRVLMLTPVYHPFFDMTLRNGRKTLEVPMALNGEGRYCFDISAMEAAADRAGEDGEKLPLMLFCSPHNPGGSVWSAGELQALLDFAARRNILVVSDEIHADFVHEDFMCPPRPFLSLASFPEHASRVVVVSGANKSFNLGGLHVSHFIVRDERRKAELKAALAAEGGGQPDIFSLIAAETAFRSGAAWLEELRTYIRGNIEEALRRLNNEIPGMKAYRPQGTYLIWASVSALIEKMNYSDDVELVRELEREGRVKLTPGSAFGRQGRGFVRINTACPRSQLSEGLNRMAYFFSKSRNASSLT
jgi:cystathionine beta-lyase